MTKKMRKFLCTDSRWSINFPVGLLFAFAVAKAWAAGGALDQSFGEGKGYVTMSTPYSASWAINGGVALPDGRAVIGGYADTRFLVRRYLPSGGLDTGFGRQGTAEIGDLERAESFGMPEMNFSRNTRGEIMFEERGIIRRLSAEGQVDTGFLPKKLRWTQERAYFGSHMVFPFDDDRIATIEKISDNGSRFVLRYFLRDGNPDLTRGGTQGEVLLPLPAGGRFDSFAATATAEGKVLVAVQHIFGTEPQSEHQALLLFRYDASGVLDSGFGSNGLVTLATDDEPIESLSLAVGSDQRIALSYEADGWSMGGQPSLLVVHLLRDDGRLETNIGEQGRIRVVLPSGADGPFRTGGSRIVTASPQLAIVGPSLLWQMDLSATGPVPAPVVRQEVCTNDSFVFATQFSGGSAWWYCMGLTFTTPSGGYAALPGAAYVLPAAQFAHGGPAEIRAQFDSSYYDRIDGLQPTGGKTVTAVHTKVKQGIDRRLVQVLWDGVFNERAGSALLSPAIRQSLIRSTDGSVWSLTQGEICSGAFTTPPCTSSARVAHYLPDGSPDLAFATSGWLGLPNEPNRVGQYSADLLPSSKLGVGYVSRSSSGEGATTAQVWTYQPDGSQSIGFYGLPQVVPVSRPGLRAANSVTRFLPGKRLQTLVGLSGNGLELRVLRWLSEGEIDPSHAVVDIALPTPPKGAVELKGMDAVVLPDGRTVFAVFLAGPREAQPGYHRRLVGRLSASGRLDSSFGDRGWTMLDSANFPSLRAEDDATVVKLSMQADGRILLGHTAAHAGASIGVVRLLAGGALDPSFVPTGGHELRISVTGGEVFSDFARAGDGGLFVSGSSKGKGLLARLHGEKTPEQVQAVPAVEFFNSSLNHYFVTGGRIEIAGIESGAAGPGWSRTGLSFKAYVPETGISAEALPVCRFYGTPGLGPNSHFYTVDPLECEGVRRDPGWTYEGTAFYIVPPASGQCATGTQPVYRAYNTRFAQNDSNHRYTTDAAVYAQMQAQGWAGEGAGFCAPN